jgi:hypothetical protein
MAGGNTDGDRRPDSVKRSAERLAARQNRPCDYCGAEFTPKNSMGTTCSTKCRVALYRRKHRVPGLAEFYAEKVQPTLTTLAGLLGHDRSTYAPASLAYHAELLERHIKDRLKVESHVSRAALKAWKEDVRPPLIELMKLLHTDRLAYASLRDRLLTIQKELPAAVGRLFKELGLGNGNSDTPSSLHAPRPEREDAPAPAAPLGVLKTVRRCIKALCSPGASMRAEELVPDLEELRRALHDCPALRDLVAECEAIVKMGPVNMPITLALEHLHRVKQMLLGKPDPCPKKFPK